MVKVQSAIARGLLTVSVAICVVICPTAVLAQETKQTIRSFRNLPTSVAEGGAIDPDAGTIVNRQLVPDLLKKTLLAQADISASDEDFNCIIHVLRWADRDEKNVQKIDKQAWYLFRAGRITETEFRTSRRILGVKDRVWIYYVHLNVDSSSAAYVPRYEITVTKKAARNISNLTALAALFPTPFPIPAKAASNQPAPSRHWWGGDEITAISDLPVDISVNPQIVSEISYSLVSADGTTLRTLPDGTVVRIEASIPEEKVTPLAKPEVFDNEGKAWWDVSVGVPIRGVKELKIEGNQAVPGDIDRLSLMAVLSLFIPPVDIKSDKAFWIPRPVIGIGITETPGDRILVGGAAGLPWMNFYAGGLLVRSPKKEDGTRERKWQFTFGVNFPVNALAKKLGSKN